MNKTWSKESETRLLDLTKEHGKNPGINIFCKESNKSRDAVRMKYNRLMNDQKEKIVEEAHNEAELDNVIITAYEERPNWFQRLVNLFAKFW